MKMSIKTQCDDCGGSGLYSGMCEGKGRAVVCLGCDGTGCKVISYTPFTERKIRRDIQTVSLSRGRLVVTGVGARAGTEMSYEQFLKTKKVAA